MKLPREISPCPIVQSIIELRLAPSPSVPADAIFGLAYSRLRPEFPSVINLPIVNIPEQLRQSDPNLAYQPLHKFSKDNLSISIGPRVIVFACSPPYVGWEVFHREIRKAMEALIDIEGYVIRIERLGLRVVNIFDGPIAESIIFNVTSSPLPLAESQFHSTFVYQEGEFKNTLQIGNNVDIVNEGKVTKASILDIDTFKEDATDDILLNLWDLIDRAHTIEKFTFFSLLRPEKLLRLNPVY